MAAGRWNRRAARRRTARGAVTAALALGAITAAAGAAQAAGPPATIAVEMSAKVVRAAADAPPVKITITVRDAAGELVAPADIPGMWVYGINVGQWQLDMRSEMHGYDPADGRWHATAYPSTQPGRYAVSAHVAGLNADDWLTVGTEPLISGTRPFYVFHDRAELAADVLEQGAATTVHLEWGAASTAERRTPDQPWSRIYFSDQQRVTLSGLAPSTTYQYRFVAANLFGPTEGPVATFTTAAAPAVEPPKPGDGGHRAPAPAPPRLSGATLAPRRLAVRRGSRGGATLRFTLDRAARVTGRIESARPGVRSGKACKPAGRGRRGRSCTRWVAAGTLSLAGRAGANAVAFDGRAGRRALSAGRHRLVLTPAGGRPATIAFTVR